LGAAAVLDLDSAVRLTVSVADPDLRVSAFTKLCRAVGALGAEQAARIVGSTLRHNAFSEPAVRTRALMAVAELGLDGTEDPHRILNEAYAAARRISDRATQASMLTTLAKQP
jgi:hypothetical protein